MALLLISGSLLYGGGVVAAMIVMRSEFLRDKGWFQALVVLWGVSTGTLFNYAFGRNPASTFFMIPAGLFYGPCVAYFFATTILWLRMRALGDHKLKVEPTFDQAEAAERRQDMPAALRLYQAAAQANPGHAETRRRLGEAYLKSGDKDSGIAEMRTSLGLVEDPEKKMSLAFRVADLLVELKQDRFNADMILREIERDYSGSRIGELAKARRSRLGAAGQAPSAP